jgi:hypothetical protein
MVVNCCRNICDECERSQSLSLLSSKSSEVDCSEQRKPYANKLCASGGLKDLGFKGVQEEQVLHDLR